MEDQVSNNKSELNNLSLRDIFYKYIRFLPLFVLSVAFALLIAYLYLRYTIPIYSVTGSMVVRSEQPGGGRTDDLENLMGGNKASNILNEIEVLKSDPLMRRVVDSLDLQWSYSAKGKIKTVNVYKQGPFLIEALEMADSNSYFTFKIRFRNEKEFRIDDEKDYHTFGQVFRNSRGAFRLVRNPNSTIGKEYSVTWTPTNDAASQFAGAIVVAPKTTGTGILYIGMRTTNSKMGADVINKLMGEYALYSVEQKNKTSIQKLEFIDLKLLELQQKIDSIQQILNVFEKQNNLIDAKTQSENYFGNVSDADKVINELSLKLSVTDMLVKYLQQRENWYQKVPTTLNLDDITLNQLVSEYNKYQIGRQVLLDGNVPEGNPRVKEASDQIEKLRTSILENLKNIRASLTSNISTVRGKSQQNQSQLRAMPEKIQEQLKIQGQVVGLQDLEKLLQEERIKQAIIKSANVPNSDIINPALPSTVPVKPNRRSIQILAILIGLGLPALVIFLGEILNDKVTTRADIEKITAAPILGEIGHSYSDKVMVVTKTTRSMVAEQFRIIRSNLAYVLSKKEKSTILLPLPLVVRENHM